MQSVSDRTEQFLLKLSKNNAREWFHAHKESYQEARNDFASLIKTLLQRVDEFYPIGLTEPKDCIYRQQRDIRFSKDKTPYTTHMSAYLAPGGKKTTNIPLYIRIKPDGESVLSVGLWDCNSTQLYHIRQEIDYNPDGFDRISAEKGFRQYFREIQGKKLIRPPKGYDSSHPQIEWLKHKEFYLEHSISAHQYKAPDFADYAVEVFKSSMPFIHYFQQALSLE